LLAIVVEPVSMKLIRRERYSHRWHLFFGGDNDTSSIMGVGVRSVDIFLKKLFHGIGSNDGLTLESDLVLSKGTSRGKEANRENLHL